jgi:ABC-type lipoprotein export system ATPase subunit
MDEKQDPPGDVVREKPLRQERSKKSSTMIEIKNLSKFFGTENGDFVAINDINLTIEDGDIFGIIGMSGAGKSTLIRCINLLEKPSEGKIIIDGQEITALEGKDLLALRRKIGMVFQKFNLLMQRTIRDNVAFPLEVAGVEKKQRYESGRAFGNRRTRLKGRILSGSAFRRTAAACIHSESAGEPPFPAVMRRAYFGVGQPYHDFDPETAEGHQP